MKMSMILKVGVAAAASLLLAACSHSSNPTPNANQTAMNSSATSYGVGSGSGFQSASSGMGSGMHVNSLKAPSNQTYYFGFDSNSVRSADTRTLMVQANYLASHPNARVRFEGNTDNRGSREYNVGLGWRRDQAVERFFTQRGVSPKQIQMVSFGKEHPIALGDTARDWALNRRVNLIYKRAG